MLPQEKVIMYMHKQSGNEDTAKMCILHTQKILMEENLIVRRAFRGARSQIFLMEDGKQDSQILTQTYSVAGLCYISKYSDCLHANPNTSGCFNV